MRTISPKFPYSSDPCKAYVNAYILSQNKKCVFCVLRHQIIRLSREANRSHCYRLYLSCIAGFTLDSRIRCATPGKCREKIPHENGKRFPQVDVELEHVRYTHFHTSPIHRALAGTAGCDCRQSIHTRKISSIQNV
jgi:hypothetical protein